MIKNHITDNISTITSFTKEMIGKGYEVSNIVHDFMIVEADINIFSNLDCM